MPAYKLSAANGQGALTEARRLHVSDEGGIRGAAGLLQPAVKAWAFSETSGRFEQMWPPGPQISSFNVTVNADGDWRKIRFSWDATGGDVYALYTGSELIWYGSGATSYDFTYSASTAAFPAHIQPGMTVTFTLEWYNTATGESAVATAVRTAPVVPPPAGITSSLVTSAGARLTVAAVPGADNYTLQKLVNSTWVTADYGPSNVFDVIVLGGSTTVWRALAHWLSYTSAPSSTRTVVAPVGGTFGPGVYTVPPEVYGAYFAGSWDAPATSYLVGKSPTSDDTSIMYAFYRESIDQLIPAGLNGRTLTRCEVYIQRLGAVRDALLSPTLYLHQYQAQPPGAPYGTSWEAFSAGSFSDGQGRWVELPLAMGQSLVTQTTWKGVTVGLSSVNGEWGVIEADLNASIPTGTLRFTVS